MANRSPAKSTLEAGRNTTDAGTDNRITDVIGNAGIREKIGQGKGKVAIRGSQAICAESDEKELPTSFALS
ncbi:uncharacterized protein ACLA_073440 [Aspergillus clavatus NRRL 1]|uniref:Uncharacterized protein n=1 Tax=Aspergillus clavatus (strain ATCC 1007 / CBS 513.65 / DSM 816 / NCTC 3887 / NRRL 1 / QM 1276 / 107) TaxID=344612 RepID=A1C7D8_ASPCL|nr:uncharacterized protein ACLA_073440 [Aspergillus clavatus NRRL 1]EAW14309.1 hypothetical protein ACLA_073440 [Aspergillus clavatus NRRL 1]